MSSKILPKLSELCAFNLSKKLKSIFKKLLACKQFRILILMIRNLNFEWFATSLSPLNPIAVDSSTTAGSATALGKWRVVSAQLSNKFGYWPSCTVNIFWHFINATAYHWGDMSLHLLLLKSSMALVSGRPLYFHRNRIFLSMLLHCWSHSRLCLFWMIL